MMRTSFFVAGVFLAVTLPRAAGSDSYSQVRGILEKHCYSCHGKEKQRASLRVDSLKALREGGNSGPALVPGRSADSLVIKAVLELDGAKIMPPKGPRLTAGEVAILRRWIDAGAGGPDREELLPSSRPTSQHWAFQAVPTRKVPEVRQTGWTAHPIDRFVLQRLEKEEIAPSPEADKVTLLRRLYLDLIGIPPTPDEVRDYLADSSPTAYRKVVDRLLASPHYGERWGRHWLDLARYADSNGYSIDSARSIWKYRDWLIGALNGDMPFDRFTLEQLAGDLLPGAGMEQKIATGFHRNTQVNEEGGIDQEQFRVEAVFDRVNTTGSVWLGLTINCAQCHDHKYDPISQKDYYRLFAFFNNSDDPQLALVEPAILRESRRQQAQVKTLEKNLKAIDGLTHDTLEKWVGQLDPPTRARFSPAIQEILALPPNGRTTEQLDRLWDVYRQVDSTRHVVASLPGIGSALPSMVLFEKRRQLAREIQRIRQRLPNPPTTLVLSERAKPRDTNVMLGGDFLRKGARIQPGTPEVLPTLPASAGLNRMDLARWLVRPDNPLTARVLVNRVWQHFFGLGLVETENDFGTQGTPPSHPELLDWLATEMIRQQWSWKRFHRTVVHSAAYRQESHVRADLQTRDPRNRLLARQNRFRLEAEVVRDSALAAAGLLSRTLGGPGVFPPQPAGVYGLTQVPKNWRPSGGADRFRRGIYTYFWRSAPYPGLTVFDAPDATVACTRRNRSNTPLQALTLLNDQAFLECAAALAEKTAPEKADIPRRLEQLFEQCLARKPTARETHILELFWRQQREQGKLAPDQADPSLPILARTGLPREDAIAWLQVARALLNLDEFITRE